MFIFESMFSLEAPLNIDTNIKSTNTLSILLLWLHNDMHLYKNQEIGFLYKSSEILILAKIVPKNEFCFVSFLFFWTVIKNFKTFTSI